MVMLIFYDDGDEDEKYDNDNLGEREVEWVKSSQELHNGRLMLAKRR